jgi:HK97 family phage major capsid protein
MDDPILQETPGPPTVAQIHRVLEFRAEAAALLARRGQAQGVSSSASDATRTFGQLQYIPTGVSGGCAAVSSTVNPADILFTALGTLKARYRAGSTWVMNKATMFTIAAFKDNQGRYVFMPTSAPGVADAVLGYPVTEAEDMPTYSTASAFSIAFGNFKLGYYVVDRIGTRVIRDPFSNKPYIGFYTTKRVGGAVVNSEAIKLLKMI